MKRPILPIALIHDVVQMESSRRWLHGMRHLPRNRVAAIRLREDAIMKRRVGCVGLVFGTAFSATLAFSQPCVTARPAPACRSCFITEIGYSYAVTSPLIRTTTQWIGDSISYVAHEDLTGRHYLTSELGYVYNLNSKYGLGFTHFAGWDFGHGLRGGLKLRLRKWLSTKTSLDVSGGALLWDFDSNTNLPAAIGGCSVTFGEWESVNLLVELLETPAIDMSYDYGDGVVLRNLTPRQRNVGVYLGYKLSSKPGLVFTGITVAGTGIGLLVLIAALAGSN